METIEKIKKLISLLGFEVESVEKKESDLPDTFRYVVNTNENAILIGNKGENLLALSHILKKILEKESPDGDTEHYFIDVGDYQNKRIQEIKNRAIILGERARFFKKDVEMPPMSSYERMIVHSAFSNYPDLKTESTGTGLERRVIIKYQKDAEV